MGNSGAEKPHGQGSGAGRGPSATGGGALDALGGREAVGELRSFRRALLRHFDRTRRDLPWRTDRSPYRVLVSEVMLQQTRAQTAAPYYTRWMQRFPGWDALADASRDEVLLAWKGLGYYARAANLHRTAVLVRERHGGRLPSDPDLLRTLPGVGEYTAGAVASIAFGACVPAVDGNVRRVLARLLDAPRPSASRLRAEAERLLDPERPGDFNEALMELGATVCVPRAPRCDRCPVAEFCRSHAAGTAAERPAPRPKRSLRRVAYAVAVALDEDGRTVVVRRPESGLLAGMWEFPSVEVASGSAAGSASWSTSGNAADVEAAARERLTALGVARIQACLRLPPVRHTFTHMQAVYHPVVVQCAAEALDRAASAVGAPESSMVVGVDDLAGVVLPVAQQKIGALLALPDGRGQHSPRRGAGLPGS